MKIQIKIFLVFTVIMSSSIFGQNAKEAIQNTKQIIVGKKMLERDINELKDFGLKLQEMKSAVSQKDQLSVDRISKELLVDMTREVGQSGAKAKMARKEIAQSSAEVRSDRREVRDDKEDSKRGRYDRRDDEKDLARDKANTRDDMRDRRDDIKDFKRQVAIAEKQAELLKSLSSYDYTIENIEREEYVIKKRMIKSSFKSFISLLKEDITMTKKELAEDNRERREDRRERQDDRDEKDEKEVKGKRRRR